MISSVAFLPRDPAGRREASGHFQLPSVHDRRGGGARRGRTGRTGGRATEGEEDERAVPQKGGEKVSGGMHTRVYTRGRYARGPVRREARMYNHCDYLVLGIDYGFA